MNLTTKSGTKIRKKRPQELAAFHPLAGTMLLAAAPRSPLVTELIPFINGLTLLCWSIATF